MPGVTYKSTRGGEAGASFEYVVLGGLARDKGLFVPETIPTVKGEELEALRGQPWTAVMYYVLDKYISADDIPREDLKDLVERSAGTFRHPDVTPVTVGVRLAAWYSRGTLNGKDTQELSKEDQVYVLELFHGPTFAFKDVALQLLGNLFEYFLQRMGPDSRVTILGATSGDTGPAAIHGLRGKRGVDCFILYPKGRTSPLQERQMTTVLDSNIHCIGVQGSFDDAQAIVKAAFADDTFRDEVKLGAINSINWARVLAQTSYYFWAWLALTKPGDALRSKPPKVDFSVPTGNFGDVLAGYYARRMGLPVGNLLVATNENDILHRFFTEGKYWREEVVPTIAPSMDICVSSNFERFLYHLCDEDSTTLRSWMEGFSETGKLTIEGKLLKKACGDEGFISGRVGRDENLENVRNIYSMTKGQHLLCPHASIGVATAMRVLVPKNQRERKSQPIVCLATAHWAKFPLAVSHAVPLLPNAPEELVLLEDMHTRSYVMQPTLPGVQRFIRRHMTSNSFLGKIGLADLDWKTVAGLGVAAAGGVAGIVAAVVVASIKR